MVFPQILSIITTQKCTAECEHCCFGCTPRDTQRLSLDEIKETIDKAVATFPTIRMVVFTGGECFLLGTDLNAAVEHATMKGLITRFVSNGYWATSRESAYKRLKGLVNVGLKEANFSTGDNHSKYVKVRNVVNGCMAALDLGIKPLVVIETMENSEFPVDEFLECEEFRNNINNKSILIIQSPWMDFSEKKNKVTYTDDQKERHKEASSSRCDSVYKTLTLGPEGSIYACCGLPHRDIPELKLGSIRDGDINSSLKKQYEEAMKLYIHVHGPGKLFKRLKMFDDTISQPPNLLHICDICRFVYTDNSVRELIIKHGAEIFSSIREEFEMLQFSEVFKFNIGANTGHVIGASVEDLLQDYPSSRFRNSVIA